MALMRLLEPKVRYFAEERDLEIIFILKLIIKILRFDPFIMN